MGSEEEEVISSLLQHQNNPFFSFSQHQDYQYNLLLHHQQQQSLIKPFFISAATAAGQQPQPEEAEEAIMFSLKPSLDLIHHFPSNSSLWDVGEKFVRGIRNGGGGGDGDENHKLRLRVSTATMKRSIKGRKKVREPRFSFKTMSEVDVLDDGYKWRKYGQKVVKNTLHPRSYYRCTQDNCRVKKRVERLAEDSRMVITTYEGRHAHSPSPRNLEETTSSGHLKFFW